MENLTTFLESSTIHGLAYIATGRKYVRLFWILVVIAGFIGAGFMTYQSFQSWAESPVKTTIETLPTTELTFPKVTVCPPKNTYTDLNYDIMMTENMTLDNDTRKKLANYAMELLYENLHDNIMRNISKLEDNDRYYNWYHGYTKVNIPYLGRTLPYIYTESNYGVNSEVHTSASSGSVTTKHFGEEFDAAKVDKGPLKYVVWVFTPPSVRNNTNATLHIDTQKVSLKDQSFGEDTLYVMGSR